MGSMLEKLKYSRRSLRNLWLWQILEVMGLTDEEQNSSVQEQINIKEQKNIKTDKCKISTTRKKQKMKEPVAEEDARDVIELSDQTEFEQNISDIMVKYTGSESFDEKDVILSQNTFNTSEIEYDENVSDLVTKSDSGWNCRDCPYNTTKRGHMTEHVEKHIIGFLFDCKHCDKTFPRKGSRRQHVPKCQRTI